MSVNDFIKCQKITEIVYDYEGRFYKARME